MAFARALAISNAMFLLVLVLCFLAWPAFRTTAVIASGVLERDEIPAFAYSWHRRLTERFEPWAVARVASTRAEGVDLNDVSGTEWPLHSAVFYLWSTQALQEDAAARGLPTAAQPRHYARAAIHAVTDLILDPGEASWVRRHWGDGYLERENLFYRMLLVSGLTSFQQLTGETTHEPLLRAQVDALAAELDASPFGLLDDYPGECYPIDVLPAIAAIARADAVLDTDHGAMIARAVRAFEDERLDPTTGLPAYRADADSGRGMGPARGVGVVVMTLWAAELWPERAQRWYPEIESSFWQTGPWLSGFRELPAALDARPLYVDVDAGPVIGGFGTAASAFGIGAARALGRYDHAAALGAEAFAAMLPMADGTLLLPRILSNATDAPYTGESIMLFVFTRRAADGMPITSGGRLPGVVVLIVAVLAVLACVTACLVVVDLRRRLAAIRAAPPRTAPWNSAGLLLVAAGLALIWAGHTAEGIGVALLARFLPPDIATDSPPS